MATLTCSIEGCERPRRARDWCIGHYNRWLTKRDVGGPNFPPPPSAVTGAEHPRWNATSIGYRGAHNRVRRTRGPASAQECPCGQPASTWAYSHSDPNELTDEKGRRYSGDTSHYEPMCWSCHIKFDRQAAVTS